jgi:hypothetical protein
VQLRGRNSAFLGLLFVSGPQDSEAVSHRTETFVHFGSDVLAVVTMKSKPLSSEKCRRFGGIYHVLIQDRHFLRLLFDPGGESFVHPKRRAGSELRDITILLIPFDQRTVYCVQVNSRRCQYVRGSNLMTCGSRKWGQHHKNKVSNAVDGYDCRESKWYI